MPRRIWGDKADDYYRDVAELLAAEMERSDSPWRKAWDAGGGRMPYNLRTERRYRGGNSVLLMTTADQRGYKDERWGTFRQVRAAGGYVRRGQKGTGIVYWQFAKKRLRRGSDGKPLRGEDGRKLYSREPLERPRVFRATVFNAEQCAGLPARPDPGERARWSPNEAAERAVRKTGALIEHTRDDACYYDFGRDRIVVPRKGDFPEACGYYQSVLHELGHWTGHPSRMNRQTLMRGMDQGLRSRDYAKEELRAEISSMMTGDALRIGHDPSRNAAYVKVWIQRLKEDPKELYRAARDAQQISDYLLGRGRPREAEREVARAADSRETVDVGRLRSARTAPAKVEPAVVPLPPTGRRGGPAADGPPADAPPAPDGPAGQLSLPGMDRLERFRTERHPARGGPYGGPSR